MSASTWSVQTHSPEETEKLGYALGVIVPAGSVIALRGDLAAGKTCLIRGMAVRFATDEIVSSPTFTIVNQYGTRNPLYHVDLYRIEDAAELAELGYEDLFEPDGVCAVEWAERAEQLLPERRVEVLLEHIDENTRRITFTDRGVLPAEWPRNLEEALALPPEA